MLTLAASGHVQVVSLLREGTSVMRFDYDKRCALLLVHYSLSVFALVPDSDAVVVVQDPFACGCLRGPCPHLRDSPGGRGKPALQGQVGRVSPCSEARPSHTAACCPSPLFVDHLSLLCSASSLSHLSFPSWVHHRHLNRPPFPISPVARATCVLFTSGGTRPRSRRR